MRIEERAEFGAKPLFFLTPREMQGAEATDEVASGAEAENGVTMPMR
jgi:hypothetical protein